MTQPEKLWCWNFQTEKGGWGKGWGGYSRPEPRYPLDERERNTGAEYVRVDIAEAAIKEARESALREAAAMCDIGPCDEWDDRCKGGYSFAADECKRNILALIEKEKTK